MSYPQSMKVLTGIAVLVAACSLLPARQAAAQTPSPGSVDYGLYMTRAADCGPCHTRPGGTPFAGGLEIKTPFGTLTSPNITPDRQTGIGSWTDDQFYAALHNGIGSHGEYLYPVMVYPSYTKMTREDVLAIKHYLFSLKPVFAPRLPSAMDFPFNIRDTMLAWRVLFFTPGTFKPNPHHSADWNRGAYLVQGAGHCGECHSPRNLLGATETSDRLAGGTVGQWLAPNISSDPLAGIGHRTVDQITAFLRTGANTSMGVAFGPMAEVVHDSLHYLTDADVHSIAVYLKEGPDRRAPAQVSDATKATLQRGARLYAENCAQCHQDHGQGIAGVIPNLADNAVVEEFTPHDMVVAILSGLTGTGGYGQMPSFAGALGDRQIADVANYVRVGLGNHGVPDVTPNLVAGLRSVAAVGAGGTEAARAFDCPAIGNAPVPKVLANQSDVAILASGGDIDMDNKIDGLLAELHQQQPGISNAALSNIMMASFCPVVADNPALNNTQRRAQLMRFSVHLQDRIAAAATQAAVSDHVVAAVPLAADVMQQVTQAAAEHHQTPAQWMAETLAHQSATSGQH
ncbi:MAG TPA: c-type cytochrome [Acetobacteraceae bacterium]|nr:c-type cytochrome [Acetobacteraceae bacterium]